MGGLITSTMLTLLVVPAAYSIVVGFQERMAARRAARRIRREAERIAHQQPQSTSEVTQGASD
jgi:hypothetical protein